MPLFCIFDIPGASSAAGKALQRLLAHLGEIVDAIEPTGNHQATHQKQGADHQPVSGPAGAMGHETLRDEDRSPNHHHNAKENDEEIHVAMEDINGVIDKFDSTIGDLLIAVEEAIIGAKQTSENSEHIKQSMDKVSKIADKVQQVIQETNSILN